MEYYYTHDHILTPQVLEQSYKLMVSVYNNNELSYWLLLFIITNKIYTREKLCSYHRFSMNRKDLPMNIHTDKH